MGDPWGFRQTSFQAGTLVGQVPAMCMQVAPSPSLPTGPHSSEPHSLKYELRNLTSDLNTISGLEGERKGAREELGREKKGEEIGRNQGRGE